MLKLVHVSCVGVSYVLFFVRGIWMVRESPLLNARWVKVLPHVVDSALLASALTLAFMLRQYPFVAGWLSAKLLALCVYPALGVAALRLGWTLRSRLLRGLLRRRCSFISSRWHWHIIRCRGVYWSPE